MAYRTYGRRARAPRPARWIELRYAGTCTAGHPIAAGERAFYDPADRSVTCTDLEHAEAAGLTETAWVGSPTSGGWTQQLRARRLESRDVYGNRFARMRAGLPGGRCEDAPCCGCCD
jgi:hypothetical protein